MTTLLGIWWLSISTGHHFEGFAQTGFFLCRVYEAADVNMLHFFICSRTEWGLLKRCSSFWGILLESSAMFYWYSLLCEKLATLTLWQWKWGFLQKQNQRSSLAHDKIYPLHFELCAIAGPSAQVEIRMWRKSTITNELTILPRLNSLNHVPGISFGHEDILTCRKPDRAHQYHTSQSALRCKASDVTSKLNQLGEDKYCCFFNNQIIYQYLSQHFFLLFAQHWIANGFFWQF